MYHLLIYLLFFSFLDLAIQFAIDNDCSIFLGDELVQDAIKVNNNELPMTLYLFLFIYSWKNAANMALWGP
jgi:hypothetical protein